jgi:antitoxin VapB
MTTAKIFKNGRSQAVRLPKECRFDGAEVGIARVGELVILYPSGRRWEFLERSLSGFTNDFMATRDQPTCTQKRRKM